MTLEEYKQLPFKYDGNGDPWLIGDEWDNLPGRKRRHIITQLKKGKVPDFLKVFLND